MSAGDTGAIGPVSVRYAAQIRDLLYAQTMQRMAADQEAARLKAQSERVAKDEAAARAEQIRQPLAARIEAPDAPMKLPEAPVETPPAKPATTAPAQLVDIQA